MCSLWIAQDYFSYVFTDRKRPRRILFFFMCKSWFQEGRKKIWCLKIWDVTFEGKMYFWEKILFPLKDLNFHKKCRFFWKYLFFVKKKKNCEKENPDFFLECFFPKKCHIFLRNFIFSENYKFLLKLFS